MAGNSQRKGARRTPGSKKGATVGSGGRTSKGLRPKGPTPRAQDREKAAKRSGSPGARGQAERRATPATGRPAGKGGGAPKGGAAERGAPAVRAAGRSTKRTGAPTARGGPRPGTRPGSRADPRRSSREGSELVVGRNAVVEALRAQVPATALFVAERIDTDDRVKEALRLATDRRLPLLEAPRPELDRMSSGSVHQGLALQVPPYVYAQPDDLARRAAESGEAPLLVALDSVTDPRNLGAVVRSAAAFGAHGVVVPERRSAGMTAGAWKASAGAAARVPVARATNLTRQLEAYRSAGFVVVGLSAAGTVEAHDLDVAVDALVLVVGSEDQGLSRLVERTCDVLVRIPMTAGNESLNAGVAAGIVLYEVARRRAASA
jgi:23S rRNA (guanosine2251-2'-O)-methyltransferase